jgi:16S rRNA (cytosine1402-N4)-methyltransferase
MIASNTPNHIPVMPNEVLALMDLKPRGKYVDGTCGLGGHAGMILSSLSKKGFLLGLDIDKDAIKICKKRLDNFSSNFHIEKKSYSELSSILKILEIGQVDGILLDLGLSSLQLDSQSRGFSFKESSSLDMRFDQDSRIDASRIINKSSESEIADIIYYYGEERRSRSIAKKIFQNRPINRVDQLVEVLKKCTPPHKRNKILARVFQSFRIAVNKELDNLSSFLEKYLDCLKVGGKIIIISFHSLEDRIVKRSFKESSRKGQLNIITKKPIIACEEERIKNSRSKSAKLRCAVKL